MRIEENAHALTGGKHLNDWSGGAPVLNFNRSIQVTVLAGPPTGPNEMPGRLLFGFPEER